MKRIYPHTRSGNHGLHSIVAVVDRLPRPNASARDGGSEGLAFVFSDDALDAPGIFNEQSDDQNKKIRDIASSLQVRRSLTFDMVTRAHYEAKEGRASYSYSVQVPLANTIFQNGLPTTLIHSRYTLTQPSELRQVSLRHLSNQSLRVPFFITDHEHTNLALNTTPPPSNLELTAPLLPLTPARKVVACMGNIVRRLAADLDAPSHHPQDNTILASQELEESVQQYFKARDISPQAVSVWALVLPSGNPLTSSKSMVDVLRPNNLARRWKSGTHDWIESAIHSPLSLLQQQVRLHKVLSGGGGWGKKAGLLSLDPESSYSPDESTSQESDFFASMGSLDSKAEEPAFRDIVSPGDYIQFYITPIASPTLEPEQASLVPTSYRQSAEFGTVPSTIDNMPQSSTSDSSTTSACELYENHFGALSEVGIALTISRHEDRQEPVALNATKIDVPFSRFSLLSRDDGKHVVSSGAGSDRTKLEQLWDNFQETDEPANDEENRVSQKKSPSNSEPPAFQKE